MIKTAGVVTRTVKYGDTSLIVTLVTKDYGRISAIASNVRTSKSRMLAGLQLFAYSEMVMYKAKDKKGLFRLNEMTVLESFSNIRQSLEKLAYASYFAEAANHALADENPDDEILRLLLNTLFALDRDLQPFEKIKTVFEWRLAHEMGYSPLTGHCGICGRSDELGYISFGSGTALCESCGENSPSKAKVTEAMLKIINYICMSDMKQIFSFDIGMETVNYLSRISEVYIKCQLEEELPTLDYLRKVTDIGENKGE